MLSQTVHRDLARGYPCSRPSTTGMLPALPSPWVQMPSKAPPPASLSINMRPKECHFVLPSCTGGVRGGNYLSLGSSQSRSHNPGIPWVGKVP